MNNSNCCGNPDSCSTPNVYSANVEMKNSCSCPFKRALPWIAGLIVVAATIAVYYFMF